MQRKYDASPEAKERKQQRDRERYQRKGDQRTPEQRAIERLKWRHKISPATWQEMWDKQNGLCYLCERPLSDSTTDIVIDHDHDHCPDNKSCPLCQRGLACRKCNIAIGLVDDDPDLLRKIAANLDRVKPVIKARLRDAT